jgi:hypothetical protein
MDEKRKPGRRAGGAVVAGMLLLLLLPLLYVASSGPAMARVSAERMAPESYLRIYAPAEAAARLTGTRRALREYQRWCGAHEFVEYTVDGQLIYSH